jgi:hypothetical protein
VSPAASSAEPRRRLAILTCMHTGCGLLDLDENVRRAVAALRAEAALPHRDRVRGAVVDVATGVVREVGGTA